MTNKDKKLKDSLSNISKLDTYLQAAGKKHRYYRSYGKFPRISNNIYKDHAIYLSDGTGWNDKYDVENFRNNSGDKKLFGLCFSYSIDESVAMWMLYGGLNDKGGMYYFTQNQMLKLLSSHLIITLGTFGKSKRFNEIDEIKWPNYHLYIKDVLYSSKVNNNKYRVYRDSESSIAKASVLRGAKHVLKHSGWSYEKETRLILEVPLKNNENIISCTHARINLDEALGSNWLNGFHKQIVYSPKCSPSAKTQTLHKNKQVIFRDSELLGMIDWDLK